MSGGNWTSRFFGEGGGVQERMGEIGGCFSCILVQGKSKNRWGGWSDGKKKK